MSETAARIVDDYLSRLDRAANRAGLSESRMRELREQLGDHLAEVRADAGSTDPVIVVLVAIDRLGDPEDIVAAAIDDQPTVSRSATSATPAPSRPPRVESVAKGPAFVPPRADLRGGSEAEPPPSVPRRDDPARWEPREIAALIFVALGWMAPLVGFLVGAVLAAGCRRWTTQERAAAITLPLTGQVVWAVGVVSDWIVDPGFTIQFGLGGAGASRGIPTIIGLATTALLLWSLSRNPVAERAGGDRATTPPTTHDLFDPPSTEGLQPVEIAAIAGIGLGWMVGGLGTLIGIVATIIGPRWTGGQKAIAILLPIAATLLTFFLTFAYMSATGDPVLVMIGFFAGGVLSSLSAAGYLWASLPTQARR